MKWSKILKEDPRLDRKIDNYERTQKELDYGEMYVEFMLDKNDDIHLIIKFPEKLGWLLGHSSTNSLKYFSSTEEFINYIKNSINNFYQSDLKKAREFVFDERDLNRLKYQIEEYAAEYELKAKSLNFGDTSFETIQKKSKKAKNSDWDMVIRFKRSAEKAVKDGKYRIFPILTGKNKLGRIVGNREQEVKWSEKDVKNLLKNIT